MSPDRHYHLQSEEANRRLDALLEQLRVPESSWPFYADMLTTVLKMYEDGAGVADLKIANATFKEIRYGFKVFAPWRNVPKVTVFGSARTPRDHPISEQAHAFGKRITGTGWMVMTGAGGGVMSSAQEGAGAERSFGLNIRLPFEQEANPWIAADPKLISFKYFFTRKLFLVREAHAMVFLPGGFGTADEAFEALTLVQTGKSPVLPLVMLDEPGGTYWKSFQEFIQREMVGRGMVSPNDPGLFRITDDVERAAAEIEGFYRLYHSQRYVRDSLVIRLRRPLSSSAVDELNARFKDILLAPADQAPGPLPAEGDEFPDLPRLVLPFNRTDFARLRLLLDFVNES
ncbi:MAG TPA: LOG family protein [Candidatus Dormibacteraeota bacterium]|nr:LOG family protein [Candidatus Dormibacteraeota bacterium]